VDQAAAVCGFQAEYEDGTIVKGVVKEKQLARQEFQHAVQQGKQANLLEAVRRDVFTLNVGNIPASGYVKITITYVTSLQAREDAAAFVLPMYIAPRYTPQGGMPSEEQGLTVRNQSNVMLFGLDIAIEFTSRSNIKGITTPTHAQEPSLSCDYQGKTGQFLLRDFTMDRDLVVLLEEEQCHQPRVVIEASEAGTLAGFVTLFPKLEFRDLKREFVFLIDRSGSMDDQNKMKQARETLLLFLRSLPVSCTFNIVGFGSRHSSLFHTPMPYNDETLESASTWLILVAPKLVPRWNISLTGPAPLAPNVKCLYSQTGKSRTISKFLTLSGSTALVVPGLGYSVLDLGRGRVGIWLKVWRGLDEELLDSLETALQVLSRRPCWGN